VHRRRNVPWHTQNHALCFHVLEIVTLGF
jgi:hypothetical protein